MRLFCLWDAAFRVRRYWSTEGLEEKFEVLGWMDMDMPEMGEVSEVVLGLKGAAAGLSFEMDGFVLKFVVGGG